MKKINGKLVSDILYWGGFILACIGIWQIEGEAEKHSFEAGRNAGYETGKLAGYFEGVRDSLKEN